MVLHDDAAFSLFGDHAPRSLERVLEQGEDEMDIEGGNAAAIAAAAAAAAGGINGDGQHKLDEDHELDSTGDSASPGEDLGERGRARPRVGRACRSASGRFDGGLGAASLLRLATCREQNAQEQVSWLSCVRCAALKLEALRARSYTVLDRLMMIDSRIRT